VWPRFAAFGLAGQALASRAASWKVAGMTDLVDDTRVFRCARCHEMVRICRRCDRGNRYCSRECSRLGRQGSLREARRRYARSHRGRARHAARQVRYRARRSNADPTSTPYRGFTSRSATWAVQKVPALTSSVCLSCGRLCSDFVRLDFLTMIRHRRPSITRKTSGERWNAKRAAQSSTDFRGF
jgi:hypothetical protein